jgi:ureidoacrylate peracid hydrolase
LKYHLAFAVEGETCKASETILSFILGDILSSDNIGLLLTLAEKVDPAHCALLVIDVQNDFAADGGFFDKVGGDLKPIQQQRVPALLRLIDEARSAGATVIFVQAIYDPSDLSAPMRERNARLKMEIPRCLTGSWGAEFYRVEPRSGEPVVIKHRYSAMVNTELPALLKRQGIRSLLLTGIATDTCVESAGRDAYFIDYYVTIVADCCGAASEEDHRGALKRFNRDYGQVVMSADVIDIWNAEATSRHSPARAATAK